MIGSSRTRSRDQSTIQAKSQARLNDAVVRDRGLLIFRERTAQRTASPIGAGDTIEIEGAALGRWYPRGYPCPGYQGLPAATTGTVATRAQVKGN